jgi:hypothetical protein
MIRNSFFIILLCCSLTVTSQHPVPFKMNNGNDLYGAYEKKQIEDLHKLYSLRFESDYKLISGREYLPYYFRSKSKPILFINRRHSSSITINGRNFNDLNLDYDTFTDEVLYIDSTRTFIYTPLKIALNKDNVNGFELCFRSDTLSFRYFSKVADSGFDLDDGFYEVAYDGDCKFLIKHRSAVYENNGIKEYSYVPVGYVNAGNGFVKIKSKAQLCKLFGKKSDELKKYIKKSGINIRQANKSEMVSLLKFCDNLKTLKN